MNGEQAQRVWDILAACAGAPAHLEPYFIESAVWRGISEFRFQGDLGFGGKYYGDNRVSCYPEDMNDARKEIIRNTNEKLSEVF